jgi:hypothetical protein
VGLLALISGLLALAAAVAGGVFLFGKARELLRGFRAFSSALSEETARLDAATQRLSSSGERAGGAGDRLEESLSRLAVSQSRLGVLLAAAGEVRASAKGVVPRK